MKHRKHKQANKQTNKQTNKQLACQFRPAANMQTSFTLKLDMNMGTDIYCG